METHTQQSTPHGASVLWQNRNEGKKLFGMADGSTKQNRLTFYHSTFVMAFFHKK